MSEESAIHERVCGFLLLVEHRNHVAVFKSKLDVPAGFVTRYLGRVGSHQHCNRAARSSISKDSPSQHVGVEACDAEQDVRGG
jgi:hypothetical protein